MEGPKKGISFLPIEFPHLRKLLHLMAYHKRLMGAGRLRYDQVIEDTPPLLPINEQPPLIDLDIATHWLGTTSNQYRS